MTTGEPLITIGPTGPSDLVELERLIEGLSFESRYRRYFSAAIDVHRAAAWAAHPDDVHAVGLVARAGGHIVGHGVLVPIAGERGEVAFEVAKPWRHHGIASMLLRELEHRGGERGITALEAEVLASNHPMLDVFHAHGPCRERRDDGVIHVELCPRLPY
jgi:GNAT superfamily N-acetyltransferase